MTYVYRDGRENPDGTSEGFGRLLAELEAGDCMVVERFSGAAKNVRGFLGLMEELDSRGIRFRSLEEGFDTGSELGKYTLSILKRLGQLDGEYRREKQREGIHNAKEEGKYKGRKPIEVDEETFDSILRRWKNGEITARQAMDELNLKPNTFYRRVRERMADTKNGEDIWDAARQLGKDIVDGVQAGTEELQQAAEKFASEVDADAVAEQIGRNLSAAGKVLNRYVGNLARDFQDAMDPKPEEAPPAEEEGGEDKEWI